MMAPYFPERRLFQVFASMGRGYITKGGFSMAVTGASILDRMIEPEKSNWSAETARALLMLDFRPVDHHRMEEHSAKASAGSLSAEERLDLEEYLRVADMVAILQSKARLALKQDAVPG